MNSILLHPSLYRRFLAEYLIVECQLPEWPHVIKVPF
jgi:hypothetical protein